MTVTNESPMEAPPSLLMAASQGDEEKASQLLLSTAGLDASCKNPNLLQQAPTSLLLYPSIHAKPHYSYASLIGKSILNMPEKRARLSMIYQWIASNFPYYQLDQGGWQNSIRHNLTVNRCFIKDAREDDPPGKGSFWAIHPEYLHYFQSEISDNPQSDEHKPGSARPWNRRNYRKKKPETENGPNDESTDLSASSCSLSMDGEVGSPAPKRRRSQSTISRCATKQENDRIEFPVGSPPAKNWASDDEHASSFGYPSFSDTVVDDYTLGSPEQRALKPPHSNSQKTTTRRDQKQRPSNSNDASKVDGEVSSTTYTPSTAASENPGTDKDTQPNPPSTYFFSVFSNLSRSASESALAAGIGGTICGNGQSNRQRKSTESNTSAALNPPKSTALRTLPTSLSLGSLPSASWSSSSTTTAPSTAAPMCDDLNHPIYALTRSPLFNSLSCPELMDLFLHQNQQQKSITMMENVEPVASFADDPQPLFSGMF